MIASLAGILSNKTPQEVILEVHGVGYQIAIPLSTYFALPEVNTSVQLFISTHIRNDTIQLFGFGTREEKQAFLLLTGVTSIGPKLALSALSTLSVQELCKAIEINDTDTLASIPGIGKKSAARMNLELKDKTSCIGLPVFSETSRGHSSHLSVSEEEATSALLNLGYRPPEVKKAISQALNQLGDTYELENLIRISLKELAKN
ncbi:MAG: Holliday junction branch migration protein RuvA [Nitrospirales bacterium]|nr:Holliday junction branch migration protein RuvA [Nitrospirales bacterium]